MKSRKDINWARWASAQNGRVPETDQELIFAPSDTKKNSCEMFFKAVLNNIIILRMHQLSMCNVKVVTCNENPTEDCHLTLQFSAHSVHRFLSCVL